METKILKNLKSLHNKILNGKLRREFTEDEIKTFMELEDLAIKEINCYEKGIKDFVEWFFNNKYKSIATNENYLLVVKDGIWEDAVKIFLDMIKSELPTT